MTDVSTMLAPDGVQIVQPASREAWLLGRRNTVGASELPALFGVSRYLTPFELFAIKSGVYVKDFAEAMIESDSIHLPPTELGNLLEDDAFELLARLRPNWRIDQNTIPGGCVYVDPVTRMSSTPDGFAYEPAREGRAVVQIKTMNEAVFHEHWLVDGEVQAPVAVAIQAIDDATLSGCKRAYAGAMTHGFRTSLYLVEVPLHAALMIKARELVRDFWRRVAENDPYPPDFARDGEVLAAIYAEDDGSEINLAGNARVAEIVWRREMLKAREADGAAAEKEREALDVELKAALGNAARGRLGDGRLVCAPTIHRKAYSVPESSYRAVKVIDTAKIVKAPKKSAPAPAPAPAPVSASAPAKRSYDYEPGF